MVHCSAYLIFEEKNKQKTGRHVIFSHICLQHTFILNREHHSCMLKMRTCSKGYQKWGIQRLSVVFIPLINSKTYKKSGWDVMCAALFMCVHKLAFCVQHSSGSYMAATGVNTRVSPFTAKHVCALWLYARIKCKIWNPLPFVVGVGGRGGGGWGLSPQHVENWH